MKPYLLLFAAYLICVAQTFAQNQEIRLFSHRGGRLEHDENTLRAFEASYRAGYRGFETDVRMTRDGRLISIPGYIRGHSSTRAMQHTMQ